MVMAFGYMNASFHMMGAGGSGEEIMVMDGSVGMACRGWRFKIGHMMRFGRRGGEVGWILDTVCSGNLGGGSGWSTMSMEIEHGGICTSRTRESICGISSRGSLLEFIIFQNAICGFKNHWTMWVQEDYVHWISGLVKSRWVWIENDRRYVWCNCWYFNDHADHWIPCFHPGREFTMGGG